MGRTQDIRGDVDAEAGDEDAIAEEVVGIWHKCQDKVL